MPEAGEAGMVVVSFLSRTLHNHRVPQNLWTGTGMSDGGASTNLSTFSTTDSPVGTSGSAAACARTHTLGRNNGCQWCC